MLKKCEKEPRFYAFLRVCQSKPESGRQHLADLMMHPIQVNLNNNNIYFLKKCLKSTQKNAQNSAKKSAQKENAQRKLDCSKKW